MVPVIFWRNMWNYRVVEGKDGEDTYFYLIEAYYITGDYDPTVERYTCCDSRTCKCVTDVVTMYGSVSPKGDTLEGLHEDLSRMMQASKRPIIKEMNLPKEKEKSQNE